MAQASAERVDRLERERSQEQGSDAWRDLSATYRFYGGERWIERVGRHDKMLDWWYRRVPNGQRLFDRRRLVGYDETKVRGCEVSQFRDAMGHEGDVPNGEKEFRAGERKNRYEIAGNGRPA